LFSILIIAAESKAVTALRSGLTQNGFTCSVTADGNEVIDQAAKKGLDLVLVEVTGHLVNPGIRELCQRAKPERPLPIIALIAGKTLDDIDSHLDVGDFITSPYDTRELVLRIKRLLHKTRNMDSVEQIRCGDLIVDLAKCEVTLEGRLVVLTFREYELLKFLAGNKGRVYTREALLNKVWDYDYYGGDRTIDVHIRRLRSKIEDPKRSFIETVRNIGYRFREDV
jgi:DNA-binding response OmpR family regulator